MTITRPPTQQQLARAYRATMLGQFPAPLWRGAHLLDRESQIKDSDLDAAAITNSRFRTAKLVRRSLDDLAVIQNGTTEEKVARGLGGALPFEYLVQEADGSPWHGFYDHRELAAWLQAYGIVVETGAALATLTPDRPVNLLLPSEGAVVFEPLVRDLPLERNVYDDGFEIPVTFECFASYVGHDVRMQFFYRGPHDLARREMYQPERPGPYVYGIALAGVIAANPEHGTYGEVKRNRAEHREFDVHEGDLFRIDGRVYRFTDERGRQRMQYPELVLTDL